MSQVDQVRAAADIVKIVGDYVKLRKSGANYVGLCPFHQEKTPSFAVHPVKQIFHCFGCGKGGDVFKFVMEMDNLPFPEALRRVAEKVGVHLEERAGDETYDANTKLRTALIKLHDIAAKFYAAQLGATTEGRMARAYLADRGMTDEAVGRFRIGYAPADGQGLLRQLGGTGFEKEVLEKSGLIIHDAERQRIYDRFRRRIIYPIANDAGKVVAFAGRALGDDQPKYLNSPETAIYTKSRLLYHLDRAAQAIRKLDYAILVEGYMDCIAVASSGIENVVASCGTSLTEGQIRLLGRYTRRVVVNYDPDSAGMAATERSLALLLEAGFEAKVLALPGGLDPDEFIRKKGVSAYGEFLKSAPNYIDYLTDRAMSRHDVRTAEGKAAIAKAITPSIASLPDPLIRADLVTKLADRIQAFDPLSRSELNRAARASGGPQAIPTRSSADATPAEAALLQAFLKNEGLADKFLSRLVDEGLCVGLATEGIFKCFLQLRQTGQPIDPSKLDSLLTEKENRVVAEHWAKPGEVENDDYLEGCYRALKAKKLENELARAKSTLREALLQSDPAKSKEIMETVTGINNELRVLKRGCGPRPN